MNERQGISSADARKQTSDFPEKPLPMPRPELQNVLSGIAHAARSDQLRLAAQALAQIRESVVITDTDLEKPGPRIVYVNAAFTRMTGWTPAEVVGQDPRILQGPKTTRATLDRLRAQLEKGESFEGDDINYRKDGSEFHIDWYIEPLRDPSGEIAYWVAVQRDVTERRQLQAQLFRAQRLEGIGLLASGIAHDLNNVLAPVLMSCDYLRKKGADKEALQFIQLLESSAKRGAGLVRQILSFGRGLTGKALVDPRHVVNEIATMTQATFPKSIRIVADAPILEGSVETDPTQLHQVLLNLCINARDAIDGEGTITLTVRNVCLAHGLETVREKIPAGAYIEISVSDTGCGMSAETARKIFDPFFSTKAPSRGTGLGLSTVAMIIQEQRGAIVLRTAPGEGTTFSIYLPQAGATLEHAEQIRARSAQEGDGRSILIADDEAAISEIMKEMLSSVGYKIETAASGFEALALAKKFKPQLMLVDLMMPGPTNGVMFAEMRSRFPSTPLIVMSGMSLEEIRREAPTADAYLQKPFALDELLDVVHDTFARAQEEAAA